MSDNDYKDWYESVDFIQNEMQFYSFQDFYKNALAIKRLFNTMERHGKKLYQWYLYASLSVNYNQKNLIWDYLNGFADYTEIAREYRLIFARLEQRKK